MTRGSPRHVSQLIGSRLVYSRYVAVHHRPRIAYYNVVLCTLCRPTGKSYVNPVNARVPRISFTEFTLQIHLVTRCVIGVLVVCPSRALYLNIVMFLLRVRIQENILSSFSHFSVLS